MAKMKPLYHEIGSHFVFKGKRMRQRHEVSASISRRRNEVRQQILRAMRQSLARLKPNRALDVGTGFGTTVEFLARRLGKTVRIWSIDPSPRVLREIRAILKDKHLAERVTFKQAKAEALPFRARYFDLVVSLFSIHHLANPVRGLREIVRVLSKDGKLIVADWRPINSSLVPHSAGDIPSPSYVVRVLKRVGCFIVLHKGRYWYMIEASK